MPSPDETIEELERLELRASQPFWEVGSLHRGNLHIRIKHASGAATVIATIAIEGLLVKDIDRVDAALICAMRNALPNLLADRRQMRSRIDQQNATINRLDNQVLTQGKRIKGLEAVGRKLLFFKRRFKHENPEEYERSKEALWDALEELIPDWDGALGQSDPMVETAGGDDKSFQLATVLSGPMKGKFVCILQERGEFALCIFGNDDYGKEEWIPKDQLRYWIEVNAIHPNGTIELPDGTVLTREQRLAGRQGNG